ncbi:unnamed protein product [Eruca vesicaria subsp. sativa]|uniref:Uncharacterized protein n=1 Tax=Eruca vesicaria subsp. sativa TaxID=29727 RepID=A0ABC8LM84_ERUVS|nr:unnamed protein product [Eruca vesicaria subsp. sativa]
MDLTYIRLSSISVKALINISEGYQRSFNNNIRDASRQVLDSVRSSIRDGGTRETSTKKLVNEDDDRRNTLEESDKKSKRKPGLPEAPTNMLDDSKRGMPKKGLTFDLAGSADILVIAFSFVFISTVMFATTFVVWKLGAIDFNEN